MLHYAAALELIRRLNAAADELQVTSARRCGWRPVALGSSTKPSGGCEYVAGGRRLAREPTTRAEARRRVPAPVFRAVRGGDGIGHRSGLGRVSVTANRDGRPAGRDGRRARGTVRIARESTACRSLTVVARHTGAVLDSEYRISSCEVVPLSAHGARSPGATECNTVDGVRRRNAGGPPNAAKTRVAGNPAGSTRSMLRGSLAAWVDSRRIQGTRGALGDPDSPGHRVGSRRASL